jgi:hypothetical protein
MQPTLGRLMAAVCGFPPVAISRRLGLDGTCGRKSTADVFDSLPTRRSNFAALYENHF